MNIDVSAKLAAAMLPYLALIVGLAFILPILLIAVLFGLATDYQVFPVTRMREEHVHGTAPDAAMIIGFRHGTWVRMTIVPAVMSLLGTRA